MSKFSRILASLFIFVSVYSFADDGTGENSKPVKWRDVKSWTAFGTRWAAGRDQAGNIIAVYDLSYPRPLGVIPLGDVGKKTTGGEDIVNLINSARQDRLSETSPEAEMNPQNVDQAISKLSQAEKLPMINTDLPQDWWKTVPWKDKDKNKSPNAPARFFLDDVDFQAATGDHWEEFKAKLAQAEQGTAGTDPEPVFGKDLLHQFEFTQNPDGSYKMLWRPNTFFSDKPYKIADLMAPKEGMYISLAVDAVKLVINQAIGLVQPQIVGALLSTILDRVFRYHYLLRNSHQEMALELIHAAEEGSPSSFKILSADQRKAAAIYIYYARTKLSTVWRWLFSTPEGKWQSSMDDAKSFSAKSLTWLDKHKFTYTLLNARYAVVTAPTGEKFMELLSRRKPQKLGPEVSVNYGDPTAIQKYRIFMEVLDTGVAFGTQFIPTIGGLVQDVYEYFVDDPIQDTKLMEARLTAHLEERDLTEQGNWTKELLILDGQRINPFEMTRQDSDNLISNRKKALGIGPIENLSLAQ